MPRHLISDAHEWINEIPTVPIYYLIGDLSDYPTVVWPTGMLPQAYVD